MRNYLSLMRDILEEGGDRTDRTGTGTKSLFGRALYFDMADGFPLVTTKKVFFKGVAHELLWMLSGSTNIKYLQDNGVRIWDEWATKDGDLGPVYGYQWRNFNGQGIDQIQKVIDLINEKPDSRRMTVITANPAQEEFMAMPPCPSMFQLSVSGSGLSMNVYQRSCDYFLGGPFDIAQYALLLSMMAKVTRKTPRELNFFYGDVHIYRNHLEQVAEQLSREPRQRPTLVLGDKKSIFDYKIGDIELVDYDPLPSIKGEVSV